MIDPDIDPESDLGTPFGGLVLGQKRTGFEVVVADAVWYNTDGRRIGWGALSSSDFRNIQNDLNNPRWHLGQDEKFVVVTEGVVSLLYLRAHHANFDRLGAHTVFEVGPEYLAAHGSFIVTRGEMMVVMRAAPAGGELKYPGGVAFRAVSPAEFADQLLAAPVG